MCPCSAVNFMCLNYCPEKTLIADLSTHTPPCLVSALVAVRFIAINTTLMDLYSCAPAQLLIITLNLIIAKLYYSLTTFSHCVAADYSRLLFVTSFTLILAPAVARSDKVSPVC